MTPEEKKYILDYCVVLKLKSGSHLYGLETENSDEDYLGVVFEPLEFLLSPFKGFEEIDNSHKSKHDNGRNTSEAIDEKYYSLTKFIKLLMSNNPTILELLFSKENIVEHPVIKKLYDNRRYILSGAKIDQAFIGYAISQEKKLEIKGDNMNKADAVWEIIKDIDGDGKTSLEKYITDNDIKPLLKLMGKDHLKVGTRKYVNGMLFKKFKAQIKELREKKSSRFDLVNEHGYDTKFYSHTIRLLLEGIELLTTGKLEFPLKDKEYLLKAKLGKHTHEEAMKNIKDLKARYRSLSKKDIVVSDNQNFAIIENILIDFYKEQFGIK